METFARGVFLNSYSCSTGWFSGISRLIKKSLASRSVWTTRGWFARHSRQHIPYSTHQTPLDWSPQGVLTTWIQGQTQVDAKQFKDSISTDTFPSCFIYHNFHSILDSFAISQRLVFMLTTKRQGLFLLINQIMINRVLQNILYTDKNESLRITLTGKVKPFILFLSKRTFLALELDMGVSQVSKKATYILTVSRTFDLRSNANWDRSKGPFTLRSI